MSCMHILPIMRWWHCYLFCQSYTVTFVLDTTSKSSPEKSCSPREQPSASPYSNYAQSLYVSTTTSGNTNLYSGISYTSPVKGASQHTPLGFNNKNTNKTQPYYDQYQQPKSQDSDYNSSVGSNPNSPYQQPQTSPYTQQPHSIQSNTSSQQINPISPNSPYAAPNSPYQSQRSPLNYNIQNNESSQSPSNSYHSSPSSPYAQTNNPDSPYQQPNSPQQQHHANVIHSPVPLLSDHTVAIAAYSLYCWLNVVCETNCINELISKMRSIISDGN